MSTILCKSVHIIMKLEENILNRIRPTSSEKKREVHYYICVENAGVQGSQL